MRTAGKPVIVEGQSGTGKTTTVKEIIRSSLPDSQFSYLSARKSNDMPMILNIANDKVPGSYIIDDFHRLDDDVQTRIADLIKIAAEEADSERYPKLVIIGINKVGSELVHLVHDIAKRCGFHRIQPATEEMTRALIEKGEQKLNVKLNAADFVFSESRGDYWLTQSLCKTICLQNDVLQTADVFRELSFDDSSIRKRMAETLGVGYYEVVKEFSRGRRFRSTNDPYYKLLKAISEQDSSLVDLAALATQNDEVRGSINNIKDKRLGTLLESKPICERYFYYNSETKNFAIEDPALFYYMKHLDWEQLRVDCGFRATAKSYEFDFALSFAGENREIASSIAMQLEMCDMAVFYDEYFESNYLGKAWHKRFQDIFGSESRCVVALLDRFHLEKLWPTFEREVFAARVSDEAVIPVYLDDSSFPGIPKDIVGIKFDSTNSDNLTNRVADEIVFKLVDHLDHIE